MSNIVATEFASQPDNTVLVRFHTSENQTVCFVLESASTGPIATALLGAAKDSSGESAAPTRSPTQAPAQRVSVLPSGFCVTSDIRPQHQTVTFEFGRSCIHLDIPDADARRLAEMILLLIGNPPNVVC